MRSKLIPLLFLFCNTSLLASSTPTISGHSPIARRWYVPTLEQAEQKISKEGRPRKDKALYYTGAIVTSAGLRDVLPGGFSRNNDLDLIQRSFNDWMKAINVESPFHGLETDKTITHNQAKTEARRIWQVLSEAFARATFGVVHVVRGSAIRPDSIWNTIELPILQAKPDVIIYDVGDGANLSIKNRKQIWPTSRHSSPANSPKSSPSRSPRASRAFRRSLWQISRSDSISFQRQATMSLSTGPWA